MPGVALLLALNWQRIPRAAFVASLLCSVAALALFGWLAYKLAAQMAGLYDAAFWAVLAFTLLLVVLALIGAAFAAAHPAEFIRKKMSGRVEFALAVVRINFHDRPQAGVRPTLPIDHASFMGFFGQSAEIYSGMVGNKHGARRIESLKPVGFGPGIPFIGIPRSGVITRQGPPIREIDIMMASQGPGIPLIRRNDDELSFAMRLITP